ncbi:unnamed protein product [Vitrella brassicaformis CCMP3155]|uniref:Pseudouridine synthase RsuA/RluA-like domain-containing protein n=4 Tax=Vitrella brassicaformis TaxID=1169539 RepID=A0A0G4GHZ3_VITBC|nr:unnamed protein product [Vitrella brassicaformis CCMP3155]|eukprot:CEM29349.1 unnamed protein product [Vitrella brassicaformis CCMP3155]
MAAAAALSQSSGACGDGSGEDNKAQWIPIFGLTAHKTRLTLQDDGRSALFAGASKGSDGCAAAYRLELEGGEGRDVSAADLAELFVQAIKDGTITAKDLLEAPPAESSAAPEPPIAPPAAPQLAADTPTEAPPAAAAAAAVAVAAADEGQQVQEQQQPESENAVGDGAIAIKNHPSDEIAWLQDIFGDTADDASPAALPAPAPPPSPRPSPATAPAAAAAAPSEATPAPPPPSPAGADDTADGAEKDLLDDSDNRWLCPGKCGSRWTLEMDECDFCESPVVKRPEWATRKLEEKLARKRAEEEEKEEARKKAEEEESAASAAVQKRSEETVAAAIAAERPSSGEKAAEEAKAAPEEPTCEAPSLPAASPPPAEQPVPLEEPPSPPPRPFSLSPPPAPSLPPETPPAPFTAQNAMPQAGPVALRSSAADGAAEKPRKGRLKKPQPQQDDENGEPSKGAEQASIAPGPLKGGSPTSYSVKSRSTAKSKDRGVDEVLTDEMSVSETECKDTSGSVTEEDTSEEEDANVQGADFVVERIGEYAKSRNGRGKWRTYWEGFKKPTWQRRRHFSTPLDEDIETQMLTAKRKWKKKQIVEKMRKRKAKAKAKKSASNKSDTPPSAAPRSLSPAGSAKPKAVPAAKKKLKKTDTHPQPRPLSPAKAPAADVAQADSDRGKKADKSDKGSSPADTPSASVGSSFDALPNKAPKKRKGEEKDQDGETKKRKMDKAKTDGTLPTAAVELPPFPALFSDKGDSGEGTAEQKAKASEKKAAKEVSPASKKSADGSRLNGAAGEQPKSQNSSRKVDPAKVVRRTAIKRKEKKPDAQKPAAAPSFLRSSTLPVPQSASLLSAPDAAGAPARPSPPGERADERRRGPLLKPDIHAEYATTWVISKPQGWECCTDKVDPRLWEDEKQLSEADKPQLAVWAYFNLGQPEPWRPEFATNPEKRQCKMPALFGRKDLSNGFMQRLDMNTSGLLMLAKDERTYQHLRNVQRKGPGFVKIYKAMVLGVPSPPIGTIKNYITNQADERGFVSKEHDTGSETDKAITHYALQDVLTMGPPHTAQENEVVSIVHLKIDTGKTHQIRVHMGGENGWPLLWDTKYMSDHHRREYWQMRQLLGRHFLHSFHLAFESPVFDDRGKLAGVEKASLVSVLPEDLFAVQQKFTPDPVRLARAYEGHDDLVRQPPQHRCLAAPAIARRACLTAAEFDSGVGLLDVEEVKQGVQLTDKEIKEGTREELQNCVRPPTGQPPLMDPQLLAHTATPPMTPSLPALISPVIDGPASATEPKASATAPPPGAHRQPPNAVRPPDIRGGPQPEEGPPRPSADRRMPPGREVVRPAPRHREDGKRADGPSPPQRRPYDGQRRCDDRPVSVRPSPRGRGSPGRPRSPPIRERERERGVHSPHRPAHHDRAHNRSPIGAPRHSREGGNMSIDRVGPRERDRGRDGDERGRDRDKRERSPPRKPFSPGPRSKNPRVDDRGPRDITRGGSSRSPQPRRDGRGPPPPPPRQDYKWSSHRGGKR